MSIQIPKRILYVILYLDLQRSFIQEKNPGSPNKLCMLKEEVGPKYGKYI